MGRLIPAGTGLARYKNYEIDVDNKSSTKTTTWKRKRQVPKAPPP